MYESSMSLHSCVYVYVRVCAPVYVYVYACAWQPNL